MEIVQYKYSPDCGGRSFNLEPGNVYRCGDCGFVLYINAASAVCAIIEDDRGRILLTERKYEPAEKTLDLPGGFVDIGETAEEALQREIMEELRLEVIRMDYFMSAPNIYNYRDVVYHTLDLAFQVKVHGFKPLQSADDVAGTIFIQPDNIDLRKIGLSSIREIVRHYANADRIISNGSNLPKKIVSTDTPQP